MHHTTTTKPYPTTWGRLGNHSNQYILETDVYILINMMILCCIFLSLRKDQFQVSIVAAYSFISVGIWDSIIGSIVGREKHP